MILELLGKICTAESLANTSTYAGYAMDMQVATHNLPGATPIWLALSTNVAASYGDVDETYQFSLQGGTGTDGTDINAGASTIIQTPAIAGNDARVATAGAFILRCAIPYEMSGLRYWQLYFTKGGTTTAITIDASLMTTAPRTDFNIQVTESNVDLPS